MKTLLATLAFTVLLASGALAQTAMLEEDFWEEITIEAVQAAMDGGEALDARDDIMRTPLHYALRADPSPELVRFLIAQGAPLQPLNGKGEPLGLTAARRSTLEIQLILQEAGVDFGIVDYEGNSAAHFMARNEAYERGMLDLLLAAGVDVTAQNRNGETPALIAGINTDGAQVYADLVAAGSDPTGIDAEGNDIWMKAIRRNEDVAMLGQFLAMSEDPEAANNAGLSGILILASRNVTETGLTFLEANGFDIFVTGPQGENAMLLHALGGDTDGLQLLLDRGFDVNAADDLGNTPLLNAAIDNDAEVIVALLAAGAAVDVQNARGLTPLLALLSREQDDDLDPVIDLLLAAGADPLVLDASGATALIHAVKAGQPAARIAALLTAGVDVNAVDGESTTALMHAALSGTDPAVIEALLAAGADIAVKDVFDDTAAVLAADNAALAGSTVLALLN